MGSEYPFGLEPQPLASPRGTFRTGVLVIGAVVAASAVVAAISLAFRDDEDTPSPAVGQGVSCAAVVDVAPDQQPRHVTGGIAYDELPPSSGDHNAMPLQSFRRVITPGSAPDDVVERAVHNLEHGYVIVWYDPEVTGSDDLAAALEDVNERKVIAVPWERGGMGETRPYVLAAWGHRQDCTALSAVAVQAFFAEHGGANGDAPEKTAP